MKFLTTYAVLMCSLIMFSSEVNAGEKDYCVISVSYSLSESLCTVFIGLEGQNPVQTVDEITKIITAGDPVQAVQECSAFGARINNQIGNCFD